MTKILEHKDLDFSQIKPIQAIERNPWVKQIIEQAIKERLTNTINRKDLDDVKELVDDNFFMNYTIVTAALRNVIAFLIIVRTGHRKAESTARRKDSNRGMFFLALFFIANQ